MNETFDFVVVGSGGGSMCAALVLRAAGKSVLILEKTELVGGTTAISGGVMWIPDNRFMKSRRGRGQPRASHRLPRYRAWVTTTTRRAPVASGDWPMSREAPNMIDFLASEGIRLRRLPSWPDYYAAPGESVPGRTVVSELFDINQLGEWKSRLRPGFLPVPANLDEAMQLPYMKRSWASKKTLARVIGRTIVSRLSGKHLVTAGQALQGQMLHPRCRPGRRFASTPASGSWWCEDGRVTGVVIEKNGAEWRIGARLGVLINAGGFSRNQRMLDQYIPGTSTEWTITAPGDTGEMIEEAVRIGAAIAQMDERVGNPVALPPGDTPVEARGGAGRHGEAALHRRGPDRRALYARVQFLYGDRPGDAGARQAGAGGSQLAGAGQPVPGKIHAGRHHARRQKAETLVLNQQFLAQRRHAGGAGRSLRHGSRPDCGHRWSASTALCATGATRISTAVTTSIPAGWATRCSRTPPRWAH